MIRYLTRNFGWKIFSLFLAILMWFALAQEPEIATALSAPVQYKSMPDDLDISSDAVERVHLEVRGPSNRLSGRNLEDAVVLLDLSGVHAPGERTFTVTQWNTRLPMGVAFYRAVPSQIRLHFERLITRDVPVQPRYAGPPPDGYRIASYSVQPSRLRVTGPESHIQRIESVQTDPIDLSGVVSQSEQRVHAYVSDPQVRLQSSPQVKYHVRLEKIR